MKCHILFSGKNKRNNWRQFAWNVKSCFLEKIRKNSTSNCDIFLIFSRKQDLTFHANCIYAETICMECHNQFSWRNKKKILIVKRNRIHISVLIY